MNRLLEIGFAPAGHWLLRGENVVYELANFGTQRNILYAFVCDGEVKYVGKTVQPLRSRMQGYQNPGSSQSTNIRNNGLIKAALSRGCGLPNAPCCWIIEPWDHRSYSPANGERLSSMGKLCASSIRNHNVNASLCGRMCLNAPDSC